MGNSDKLVTPIDISVLSVEALKALAYDQLVILNQTQANITAIEAEIRKRMTEVKPNE